MPIECTDRDAAFVLDGLHGDRGTLDGYAWLHGTELRRIRHAGQAVLPTDQGRKAPAQLPHRRHNDYGQLAHIVGRADRTIDPQTVVDHWDRMGQFYASVALQRLVSCTAKNHFYRANRDLGRFSSTN